MQVVEPESYAPPQHGAIFGAVISNLILPALPLVDDFARASLAAPRELPDLVTFPEAFVPAADLVQVLASLPQAGTTACFHTGLRPAEDDRHLFQVDEIEWLVSRLRNIPGVVESDFDRFSAWRSKQAGTRFFNVGCIFMVDAENRLRVCLHPKLVKSKFERGALVEEDMNEADLLSMVTLVPRRKPWRPVNIQPLLCSDALLRQRDDGEPPPIQAIDKHPSCLGKRPPDHVDIVSVATCTRQVGETERGWHDEFRRSFISAAMGDLSTRHHFAVIVLANFRTVPPDKPGGLSGVFLPVPLVGDHYPEFVTLQVWGKKASDVGNEWSNPGTFDPREWSTRAHIAALAPNHAVEDAAVRIFAFDIDRLPRDVAPLANDPRGVSGCSVRVGRSTNDGISF